MATGQDVVNYALAQRGDPYIWGATGPDAFDCSGLVLAAYRSVGLSTPRTTSEMQAGAGGLMTITEADLQPGDLVLSKGWLPDRPSQGHVSIYMGDGKMVEAGDPVQVTTLGNTYRSKITGYRRVPGINGAVAGGGVAGGVIDGIRTATGGVLNYLPTPGNLTDAVQNVGTAMAGVAQGALSIGRVAETVTKLFLPTNLIRGAAFLFGTAFIFIGIWFLSREIKSASEGQM